MKTKAAVMWEQGEPWSIEEIELDPPLPHEVLIRIVASGLCHSDDHIRTGDLQIQTPVIGGHEGAGIIEEVGSAVTGLAVGDHVVLSFMPACGRCEWCSTGRQNLCDLGQFLMQGTMIEDGGYRAHANGQDLGAMSLLGTFAGHAVVHESSVVKIPDDVPLDKACLVGCGVTTGWGSAVHIGQVRAGETVVVVGAGGIGVNAIQGARLAGAQRIIAVDPVEFKRDQARTFGATHTAPTTGRAQAMLTELTAGRMADVAILTVGVASGQLIGELTALLSKAGRAVITSVSPWDVAEVELPLQEFTLYQKQLLGNVFGGGNPFADIPHLISLYQTGHLLLDELVTTVYKLDDVNQGYQDLADGKNIRGVIIHDH
ncbi:NDMA-dependent alcohol dehydrogenase [Mycolicibacterium sphagni]|uniref:alcohol dehydrogenase n=1 Tax=Mycolicibacterium sphagni TaxID=1786 RepID=A0A255DA51_9MYCO|nr:NDMA-dependent alcohol dehydrogenase [Mycolicibacterium sphagni]OYN76246.1 alcohol dehydrogenase [Mycolicibacterium sphagni]